MLLEEFRRAVIYACGVFFYVNRASLVCESVLGRCTDRRFDNFFLSEVFILTFMTSQRSSQSEVQDPATIAVTIGLDRFVIWAIVDQPLVTVSESLVKAVGARLEEFNKPFAPNS